jgi:hypothetical protein
LLLYHVDVTQSCGFFNEFDFYVFNASFVRRQFQTLLCFYLDALLSKIGITLFLWEVLFAPKDNSSENPFSKFYIGLFDLNAWYLVS